MLCPTALKRSNQPQVAEEFIQSYQRMDVGLIRVVCGVSQVFCSARGLGVETGQFFDVSKQSKCVVRESDFFGMKARNWSPPSFCAWADTMAVAYKALGQGCQKTSPRSKKKPKTKKPRL